MKTTKKKKVQKQLTSKDILEYYMSDKCNFILPSNGKFRHFRFKLSDGKSWRKVPSTISNINDLKKWIMRFGGIDIYYGTSSWLNPHKVSSKVGTPSTYVVADNLLLNNDLVLDIDVDEEPNMANLEMARKVTERLYKQIITYPEYVLDYISFTGSKGFRLAYIDKSLNIPQDYRKRFGYVAQHRKEFIQRLLTDLRGDPLIEFIHRYFDTKITDDPFRVVRLLGSVHSATGYVSTAITPKQLGTPFNKLITHIPNILGKGRSVIPQGEMKRRLNTKHWSSLGLQPSADDVSDLASQPLYFVTNRVLGIKKGYIPVFRYDESQKYYVDEIQKLQVKYGLGHAYVFKIDNGYVVVCLKVMQRRQLYKILCMSSSPIKHEFKKYKKILIPLDSTFLTKLQGRYTGHLSRGHAHIMDKHKDTQSKAYIGWEQVEMGRAYGK